MPFQALLLSIIVFLSFFMAHPAEKDYPSLAPEINLNATASSALPAEPKTSPAPAFRCQGINPTALSLLHGKTAFAEYLDDNSVIFEKNAEKRWPVASITKLMTAVVALEKIKEDKEITVSAKAFQTEGEAGGFRPGEKFLLRDLIKAILVSSSNDAAAAIAESLGEKAFIDAMQTKTTELLMLDTTFADPTGLSPLNQSTALDLRKLVKYIEERHPELLKISRHKETAIVELKTKRARRLWNVDRFAGEDDFLGGKTGYTDEAQRNLIGIFDIRGKEVLTIILGAESAFKETKTIKAFIDSCTAQNPQTN